jgi:hypothetical protein
VYILVLVVVLLGLDRLYLEALLILALVFLARTALGY